MCTSLYYMIFLCHNVFHPEDFCYHENIYKVFWYEKAASCEYRMLRSNLNILFSRSCCLFFFREKFSEYESYERTCIKDLPEECHREVHCCCLKPCRDDLAYRCMFDQYSCRKAHARAHKCN